MAYVRKKGRYAYLVESYRDEGGKPRQRVLAYLGDKDKVEENLAKLRLEHPEWFIEDPPLDAQPVGRVKTLAPPWDRRRD